MKWTPPSAATSQVAGVELPLQPRAPLLRPANRGSFDQLKVGLSLASWERAACKTETPGTRVCARITNFSSLRQTCACAAGPNLPPTVSIMPNGSYLQPERRGRPIKPDADAKPKNGLTKRVHLKRAFSSAWFVSERPPLPGVVVLGATRWTCLAFVESFSSLRGPFARRR